METKVPKPTLWTTYFWREYADGVDEDIETDSLKEGTNFVLGKVILTPMNLKPLLLFSCPAICLRNILMNDTE